ncbi:hypothetical protein JHK85_028112 [Glycine max]|nr:hypothetical protein JHK85_028112 [Glycine max]
MNNDECAWTNACGAFHGFPGFDNLLSSQDPLLEIWVVLDDGGHSPASNRDATVASRPKTKPKDGEGSGENEDPEQAKLQVGLNSAIVREKPNVKLNDITRLSPLDQAPDPSTLETFLGRVPMVFNVVIISPHGYFGQANVLGLLDTSGQDVASEIAAELQGYPDFIIGNYNDGNLVTSLLAYKIGVAQRYMQVVVDEIVFNNIDPLKAVQLSL